ncbi:MAG: DNA polymerase III subunit gamma/tau [Flavobacteriales bacterium]|nr:DNA polymerase III subunit gamma/tau [Flavobacteriales bacterium]
MENFVVSARKYRPATFDTVVGQQSITNTLKNAIKNNHLAQAFLFCGPRGVGKTSCARILAKTINCMNLSPEIEACNECESCQGFNNNHSFNIHELDAASNNGVDKIRELVDQVRFAPQVGKYNIYIIDEVHMLSQAAFNAFLKTLEEPPAHALFILATTEKHKIIPTILSRCQIFDFKRIQIADIAEHLAYVAKNEGIDAEQEALHIIAQKADGALRDALSIFDQIISFCGDKLTYQAVIQNLNILDYDYYFKVTDALYHSDIPTALNEFNEILNNGFDGHHFINGLGMHFRNLLVAKDSSTLSLLEVGDSIKTRYLEQSQSWQQQHLLQALELCNKVDLNYRMSKNQRLLVEITLMQICGVKEDNTTVEKKTFVVKQKPSNEVKTVVTKEIEEQKVVATPSILPKDEEKVEIDIPKTSTKAIKIVNFKDNIPKKTISINPHSKTEKQDEKKDNSVVQEEKRNEQAFSQEDLNEKWEQYANEKENVGKHNLLSILKDKKAILKESFNVCITLDNKVQEEVINDEKTKLLGYLKSQLENDYISLTVEVTPLKEEEMKAYTAEDKFKKMVKKNPDLLNLKDKFDLEIDF